MPGTHAHPVTVCRPNRDLSGSYQTASGRQYGAVGLILIQASSAARCSGMVAIPKIHPPRRRPVMRFYTRQHKHYCGIDLHARAMYVCILDQSGTILVHKNLPTTPAAFLRILAPYREALVVAVECIFTWYWLADLCAKEGFAFVLGPALYIKAIHGGETKKDTIYAPESAVFF